MKIAVSSDEHCDLVERIIQECQKRGHEVFYFGPAAGEDGPDWPVVTERAARMVATGQADEAIVFCYTGTGAALAANKVQGVRAALCVDPETARGARIWNHANVLALSIRLITPARGGEILQVWFDTPISDDEWNRRQMAHIEKMETQSVKGGS